MDKNKNLYSKSNDTKYTPCTLDTLRVPSTRFLENSGTWDPYWLVTETSSSWCPLLFQFLAGPFDWKSHTPPRATLPNMLEQPANLKMHPKTKDFLEFLLFLEFSQLSRNSSTNPRFFRVQKKKHHENPWDFVDPDFPSPRFF